MSVSKCRMTKGSAPRTLTTDKQAAQALAKDKEQVQEFVERHLYRRHVDYFIPSLAITGISWLWRASSCYLTDLERHQSLPSYMNKCSEKVNSIISQPTQVQHVKSKWNVKQGSRIKIWQQVQILVLEWVQKTLFLHYAMLVRFEKAQTENSNKQTTGATTYHHLLCQTRF